MKDIKQLIDEQQERDGIDLTKLDVGTQIKAQTRNTLYTFEVLDCGKFLVYDGGKRFETPQEVNINGSTWGGSMLKVKWLGIGMHIEMCYPSPRYDGLVPRVTTTTTAVRELEIIAPDKSWNYVINN